VGRNFDDRQHRICRARHKPSSVFDSHLSARPTQGNSEAGHFSLLFGLAPGGVYQDPALPLNLVRSYRTFSPLPVPSDIRAIGCVFSVALSMGSLPPALRQAPYPVELGLSSPRKERPSVLLCNRDRNILQIRMQTEKVYGDTPRFSPFDLARGLGTFTTVYGGAGLPCPERWARRISRVYFVLCTLYSVHFL